MTDNEEIRKLLTLFEDRLPEVEYQDSAKQVVAVLKSYNSQTYTKLAQKIAQIDLLETQIKALKKEVKAETKENIADLFDADDAVKTRVVETLSFIFKMTKDPEPQHSPKYKDILEALSQQLTPELLLVLEQLKKQLVTVTQKSPALTITPLGESIIPNLYHRFKQIVFGWARRYDRKLEQLKSMV
jgi:uncharacterized coiled-coil protein SlyX